MKKIKTIEDAYNFCGKVGWRIKKIKYKIITHITGDPDGNFNDKVYEFNDDKELIKWCDGMRQQDELK